MVRRRPFFSKVFGGISNAAKSIWRVGRKAVPIAGKVTHMMQPYLAQIANVSPEAAAALTAANAILPGGDQKSGAKHAIDSGIGRTITHHMRGGISDAASLFDQFRNHPMTQGFLATQTGQTAVNRIKQHATDMATNMGISPDQQRNVANYARSFTSGVQKAQAPPHRSSQYRGHEVGGDPRTWSARPRIKLSRGYNKVPNSMSQNIGLYGPSYFFHYFFNSQAFCNAVDNPLQMTNLCLQ